MEWNLKQHGDLLEYLAYDFVSWKLPAYSDIWASYIGHDGSGNPANLINKEGKALPESSALNKQRIRFSQYHYTVLEAMFSLERLQISLSRPYLHEYSYLEEEAYFLEVNDLIILFHAQLGRLRDALNKAAACLDLSLDKKELDELWKPRCIVLHGPRIPILHRYKDVDAYIVEPSFDSGKWNDKASNWSEFTDMKGYISLPKYLAAKKDLAILLADKWLYRMHSAVQNILKASRIRLAPPLGVNNHIPRNFSGQPPMPTVASGFMKSKP